VTKRLKVLLIIFSVVFLLAIAALVFLTYVFPNLIKSTDSVSPTPTPSVATTIKPITDLGVTWISPDTLGDLGLFVSKDGGRSIAEAKYYKVANLEDGGEIDLAIIQFDEPGGPYLYRFKKDASGIYWYLAKYSQSLEYSEISDVLNKDVRFDGTTAYKSLSIPDFLEIKSTTLKISSNDGLFSDLQKPTQVGETEYGKVYKIGSGNKDATEVDAISYPLKLADSTYRLYTIKADFVSDSEVPKITWSNGETNTSKYSAEGYVKCGLTASNNEIVNLSNIASRLTEIGKTSDNAKVYTVSATDAVMKAAYENYKLGRNSNIDPIATFASKKPVFIWQSVLGDYVIFTGKDFAGLAECGKPVIYLYPETTTQISVKVGAEITKSEPPYQNGWEVTAEPSGKLNVAGKVYSSLYWEGQGQEYPQINEGVVVKRSEVSNTIRAQLSELGLNDKEIADFLTFWMPKMPNKAYVRLSWLGTAQMNKLAPLSISPAPATLIRVFLDFAGLDQPISLPAQKLSSISRTGFTVVEWGGLLRK
jgi:hypothetical protein